MKLAIADVNERWNGPTQIQQRVQLDGGLGRTRCPVEQAQAQVDGGGIKAYTLASRSSTVGSWAYRALARTISR